MTVKKSVVLVGLLLISFALGLSHVHASTWECADNGDGPYSISSTTTNSVCVGSSDYDSMTGGCSSRYEITAEYIRQLTVYTSDCGSGSGYSTETYYYIDQDSTVLCSNEVKDPGELGVDCGGDCSPCTADMFVYGGHYWTGEFDAYNNLIDGSLVSVPFPGYDTNGEFSGYELTGDGWKYCNWDNTGSSVCSFQTPVWWNGETTDTGGTATSLADSEAHVYSQYEGYDIESVIPAYVPESTEVLNITATQDGVDINTTITTVKNSDQSTTTTTDQTFTYANDTTASTSSTSTQNMQMEQAMRAALEDLSISGFTDVDDTDEQAIIDGITDGLMEDYEPSALEISITDEAEQVGTDTLDQVETDAENEIQGVVDDYLAKKDKYPVSETITGTLKTILPEAQACTPPEFNFSDKTFTLSCEVFDKFRSIFGYIISIWTLFFLYQSLMSLKKEN